MEEKQTVNDILNEVIEEVCEKYCKFPQMYTGENEDKLYEHCDRCVLNKLI